VAGRRGLNGRQRIVDAAFELFSTNGFEKTTSREIAARAGVALGLIHKHFGSIEGLIKATDRRVLEWSSKRMEKALVAAGRLDPSFKAKHGEEDELALSYVTMALMTRRAGSQDLYFALLERSKDALGTLRANGSLRTDVSLEACAQFLLALELGALAAWPQHAARAPGRKGAPWLREDVMSLVRDALDPRDA